MEAIAAAAPRPAPVRLATIVRGGGAATLAALAGLRLLDGLDGAALGVLAPDIQRSLSISDGALGALGSLGAAVFILASVPLGYLADRSRRVVIAGVCGLAAALGTGLTGLVGGALFLTLVRLIAGVGKAATLPVHGSLLADRYAVAGRARVLALHNLADPVAAVAGPAAIGAIAGAIGGPSSWRPVFFVLAVPLGVLAAVTLLLPEPLRGGQERALLAGGAEVVVEAEPVADDGVPPVSFAAATARLRSIATLRALLLGVGVLGFALVAVPIFFSVLLDDRYGLSASRRGLATSSTEIGAVVGTLIGAVLGERLLRTDPRRCVHLIAAGTAGYGLLFSLGLLLPRLGLVLAAVALAKLVLYAGTVPVYALVAALVPARLRALGLALLGLSVFVVGGFLGGILTGLVSGAHGPRTALVVTTAPICLVSALLLLRAASTAVADLADASQDVAVEAAEELELRNARTSGTAVPALQVRGLDVSYGPVQVLFDVDLDLRQGEVLALLGTNGAGKSTVLKAISGLIPTDRGALRHHGRTLTFASAADRVGAGIVQMPGGKATFASLSVLENLLAGCHSFAWDRARVRGRISEVVALFPALEHLLDQPAGSLSGGEQQLLALAKALLLAPDVLLIDELSLGLAPVIVGELLGVIRRLRDEGTSIVLVEQSVNVALSVADRALFLERGRVRFTGPAAELAGRDDLLRAVFLGGEGG